MARKRLGSVLDFGLRWLAGVALMLAFGCAALKAQEGRPATVAAAGAPPYNIVFVIVDQRAHRLLAGADYTLPAMDAIARHGVTFENHYIASAMCSPSRAALLSGQPPQVNGVIDQMEYPYVTSLSPDLPNMGSVLKGLGYKTAYFGKFEMDKDLLEVKPTVNYSTAARPYGFDVFSAAGDIGSAPESGYHNDAFIAGESVRWLRENAAAARRTGQPFFMVTGFLNPHDVMYADANVPGQPAVQIPVVPQATPPPPRNTIYQRTWSFSLPPSLSESLTAPGMPPTFIQYQKGWNAWSGTIPADRRDMWTIFYNYYLNDIADVDRSLGEIVRAFDEMDLWRDTVIVFTADHGEMGGAHGGLKGKGPFAYEQNAHVPLLVAYPSGKAGATSVALTSHLDLLPTLVGLTGLPEARRPASLQALTGHDFSGLLADPARASVTSVRPGVLFNYVGPSTIDGDYLRDCMDAQFVHKARPPLSQAKLAGRGFVSFAFDGRYKFARYYSPTAFNTPRTLDDILKNNDVQLFDLASDPEEMRNLALDPEANRATILRMNELLNDLITKEVGVNDGRFMAKALAAK
jgi:arylsulfatase A-like enzyme